MLLQKNKGEWFYEMQFLGFNYRLTDIQCALGISQLRHLKIFVRRRQEIATAYKRGFRGIDEIYCLEEKSYARSSWHIFPVRIKNEKRDKVFNGLRAKGIGVNLHYIPIYMHPYYKKLGYQKDLCPLAEKYYKETMTLPLHPAMSVSDIKKVIMSVKDEVNNA
jgi:dTDP-4-amino-4,6-dideoxygalactose transaminase